ncbi:MAG: hypothetical protein GX087_05315 [Desulfobulbaceae bacterium]|nr:hypothetical protein [Desulfobulbaceae bacterium]
MHRYLLLVFFTLLSLVLAPSFAAAAYYKVIRDETPLREAANASSRVVSTAGKGWLLHSAEKPEKEAEAEWLEIYEINNQDGFWYVYRIYGDDVFVHKDDVQLLPIDERHESPPEYIPEDSTDTAAENAANDLADTAAANKPVGAAQVASPATSPGAGLSESLMRLTVNADAVNLRPGPFADNIALDAATVADVFIAEAWPITNSADQSLWFRLLYRVEPSGALKNMHIKQSLFVSARFAELSPLQANDRALLEEKSLSPGFTADYTDMMLAGQKKAAAAGLASSCGELRGWVNIHAAPDTSSAIIIEEASGDIPCCLVDIRTDRAGTSWYQLVFAGDGWYSSGTGGWARAEQIRIRPLNTDDAFTFSWFASNFIGRSLSDIVKRWGAGAISRKYDGKDGPQYESCLIHSIAHLPKLQVDMTENCSDPASWIGSFTLSRTGAAVHSIVVGQSNKEQVRTILGKPRSQEEQEGNEVWRFYPETEYFHQVRIAFNAQGLVSKIIVERWPAG